jgi:hypothetical protein
MTDPIKTSSATTARSRRCSVTAALTGQQFQSATNEPYHILFQDFTHVKVHRRSLRSEIEGNGRTFNGFHHVDDWIPQRLVTATGPNPLPRD